MGISHYCRSTNNPTANGACVWAVIAQMVTHQSSLHQGLCVCVCGGKEVMAWKWILGDDESKQCLCKPSPPPAAPFQHWQRPWAGRAELLLHLLISFCISCSISDCLPAAFTGDTHRLDDFSTTFSRSAGISQRTEEMHFKQSLF